MSTYLPTPDPTPAETTQPRALGAPQAVEPIILALCPQAMWPWVSDRPSLCWVHCKVPSSSAFPQISKGGPLGWGNDCYGLNCVSQKSYVEALTPTM